MELMKINQRSLQCKRQWFLTWQCKPRITSRCECRQRCQKYINFITSRKSIQMRFADTTCTSSVIHEDLDALGTPIFPDRTLLGSWLSPIQSHPFGLVYRAFPNAQLNESSPLPMTPEGWWCDQTQMEALDKQEICKAGRQVHKIIFLIWNYFFQLPTPVNNLKRVFWT